MQNTFMSLVRLLIGRIVVAVRDPMCQSLDLKYVKDVAGFQIGDQYILEKLTEVFFTYLISGP